MRTSFALVVIGTVLMPAQVVWPLRLDQTSWISMGPVLLGLVALGAGVLVGLLRGTFRYRAAVVVGLAGATAVLNTLLSFSRPAGLPDDLLPREVIFMGGVALVALSFVLGAHAMWRDRPTKPVPGP